jgi:ATP-dependent RNA helicase DHX57
VNKISVLEDTWASKANAGQRRGRAGRVSSGVSYHLTSSFTYNCLRDYAIPEMLRLGLEELVLQILALDLGDPFEFLLSAVSPPTAVSIRHALAYLDSIGATTLGDGVEAVPSAPSSNRPEDQYVESCISPLGYHLATLPVNPRIGKLMLYGVLLRCIDPILTVAAMSSVKSPFISSFDCRDASDLAKKSFLKGDSDLFTMLNAYNSWAEIMSSGAGSTRAAETFCSRNYLSSMNLRQIQQIRGQFIELLRDIGFLGPNVKVGNVKTCDANVNGGNDVFVQCALCAGMSPNIAVALASGKKAPPGKGPGNSAYSSVVKKKILESSFSCAGRGTIYVHPSSVMADVSIDNVSSSYFTYLDAVKTSKVYARDFNRMNAPTLSLFGGKVRSLHGGNVLELNGWVYFRIDPQLSQCILFLRELMDRVFLDKVLNPQMVESESPHVHQMHKCINIYFS